MFKSFRSVITLRLILLMALMLLVLFTVNTVRVVKKHLILTFLGAEIISSIKLWIEIPVAVNE
ncbi:MAG: Npt1/Npt2 family nucleotide transporter [Candidatus Symbiodolus clandestinus]